MVLPVRDADGRGAVTWNPVAELEQTTKRLASLFDAWGSGWPTPTLSGHDGFLPPTDLEETDNAYILEVELPGVQRKDLNVEVSGRWVRVSGERKERERVGILRRRTRTVGRFSCDVVLPGEVDDSAITAALADGVLTVTVPKANSERQPRRRVRVEQSLTWRAGRPGVRPPACRLDTLDTA